MSSRRPKLRMDWDRIEATAPGRFVLMGEFGDLDDRNAIAVALDRRLHVTIRPHKEGYVRLNLKNFKNVREWPTTLPVFTMTKLVANYADTLTYSESIQQALKPLLNPKYYKTDLSVQQHSQATATRSCDTDDDSSGGKHKNSSIVVDFAPQTITTDDEDGQGQAELPDAGEPLINTDQTTSEQEPRLFDEVRNSGTRVLDPVSQTDSAVIAFFLLYMAIGDSFAGSLRPSLDIEIESEIPMCRGLGSSTALGVALCGALMKVFRISAEPSVIIEWAHCVDKLYHTNVTSLHSSVVTYGGYIYYQKDRVKSFGARHQAPLGFMLIDSGIRRHPKDVTSAVIKKLKLKIELLNVVLNQLNLFASSFWRLLNDQQFKASPIKQALLMAQGILNGLGLDHERIETIQRLANGSELVVKQSQAGETVFLLYDELDESVTEFANNLDEAGFKYSYHEIGFTGLEVKQVS